MADNERRSPQLERLFFEGRRREFLERIGEGSVAVFQGAPAPSTYGGRFRQQSDFYYLTGFSEPGAVVVLLRCEGDTRTVLFPQPRDPTRERWDGIRAGVQGAVEDFGADEAFPIAELGTELPKLLEKASRVYLTPNFESRTGRAIFEAYQDAASSSGRIGRGACELSDPKWVLAQMRVRKAPEEIDMMREAARITTSAFETAVPNIAPGRWEYEIEALLDHGFRASGGDGPAYTSIVGSGPSATVLHYTASDRLMGYGDLVLIDAAASYGHYSCDVTRTYPVSGEFTAQQRLIYEVVLRAQEAVIDAVHAGTTVKELHRTGALVLIEGMIELGFLESRPPEELFEEDAHRPYFMHGIGHYLGLDTHDAGPTTIDGEPYQLEGGAVFTVEPGIYVPDDAKGAAKGYAGIGVRIEDSVIVQEGGCEVLTPRIPKLADEIDDQV